MNATRLENGHLLVPVRLEGDDGFIGEGVLEIDETHPDFAAWEQTLPLALDTRAYETALVAARLRLGITFEESAHPRGIGGKFTHSSHFEALKLPKVSGAKGVWDVAAKHDKALFPEEQYPPRPGAGSHFHDAARARFLDPKSFRNLTERLLSKLDITRDESEQMKVYANSSTGLNRALRNGTKLSAKYRKMDQALQSVMERNKLDEPLTVYRQLPASAIQKGEYHELGYMSTADSEKLARAFDPANRAQTGLVTLKIEVSANTSYAPGGAGEIVLRRDSTLIVTEKDGQYTARFKE